MKFQRSSGILLHPTSFPGPYGVGDLGKNAYRFIDFLTSTGSKLWQVLPLGPTGYGDSPYQCFSAFAGNPYLVSPDLLIELGLLTQLDFSDMPSGPLIRWILGNSTAGARAARKSLYTLRVAAGRSASRRVRRLPFK